MTKSEKRQKTGGSVRAINVIRRPRMTQNFDKNSAKGLHVPGRSKSAERRNAVPSFRRFENHCHVDEEHAVIPCRGSAFLDAQGTRSVSTRRLRASGGDVDAPAAPRQVRAGVTLGWFSPITERPQGGHGRSPAGPKAPAAR